VLSRATTLVMEEDEAWDGDDAVEAVAGVEAWAGDNAQMEEAFRAWAAEEAHAVDDPSALAAEEDGGHMDVDDNQQIPDKEEDADVGDGGGGARGAVHVAPAPAVSEAAREHHRAEVPFGPGGAADEMEGSDDIHRCDDIAAVATMNVFMPSTDVVRRRHADAAFDDALGDCEHVEESACCPPSCL
jgi:hypothetical protein